MDFFIWILSIMTVLMEAYPASCIPSTTTRRMACYQCAAHNKLDCENTQKKLSCQPNENSCITLEYKSTSYAFINNTVQKIDVTDYEKKCGIDNSDGCAYYCQNLQDIGYESCQVIHCCDTPFCNLRQQNRERKKRVLSYGNAALERNAFSYLHISIMSYYVLFLPFF